jgi:hypothetical protein
MRSECGRVRCGVNAIERGMMIVGIVVYCCWRFRGMSGWVGGPVLVFECSFVDPALLSLKSWL